MSLQLNDSCLSYSTSGVDKERKQLEKETKCYMFMFDKPGGKMSFYFDVAATFDTDTNVELATIYYKKISLHLRFF